MLPPRDRADSERLEIGLYFSLENMPFPWYVVIMKTTIDIPEEELKQAIKYTGAKTKKEAVVHAIRDFNRRQRLAELAGILGTFKDFMTRHDLEKMREDEHGE